MQSIAIITAAGLGKRMNLPRPKQYLEIDGRPILVHTLDKFSAAKSIDGIIIVADKSSLTLVKDNILKKFPCKKVISVVCGGAKRQDSVTAGIRALPADTGVVAVHDGVRPFVTPELIDKSVREAASHGACIVAIPVKDTIKRVDSEGRVIETVERAGLWRAQTPQTFKADILKRAFDKAAGDDFYGTDEASLVERLGTEIFVLIGDERNIKITTQEDLKIAESFLE